MMLQGDHGAAWRRRQRRLRSWWRHEQQTVAAVLATVTHHSHSKVITANDAPKGPEDSHQHQGGTCRVLRTFLGRWRGERPAALLEPWPQEQVQRHAGIGYELVQAFDAPVLQVVEQLPDVHHFFASRLPVVAEQVIDVPKIILENIPSRRLCREPQLAEQLIEVPTVLQGGRGASGGLQGYLPGHSSLKRTATKIADIPAPRSGHFFLPEQSATAFGEADHRFPTASIEQIVENPALCGGLQDLRSGQSSASSSLSPADLAK